jgi:hypothetical protein
MKRTLCAVGLAALCLTLRREFPGGPCELDDREVEGGDQVLDEASGDDISHRADGHCAGSRHACDRSAEEPAPAHPSGGPRDLHHSEGRTVDRFAISQTADRDDVSRCIERQGRCSNCDKRAVPACIGRFAKDHPAPEPNARRSSKLHDREVLPSSRIRDRAGRDDIPVPTDHDGVRLAIRGSAEDHLSPEFTTSRRRELHHCEVVPRSRVQGSAGGYDVPRRIDGDGVAFTSITTTGTASNLPAPKGLACERRKLEDGELR